MGHAGSGLASGEILVATRIQPGGLTLPEVVDAKRSDRNSVDEALDLMSP